VKQFPAVTDKQVVLGAACWTLAILFFIDQAIVQAATTLPYSLSGNLISDLGITVCGPFTNGGYHVEVCSPLHGLMDGTFVAVGLLQVIGAITTRKAWPLPHAYPGLAFLAAGGIGLALAGLAPENVNLSLHGNAAELGIDAVNIGMIILGAALLRVDPWLGSITLLAGIAGIAGAIILFNSLGGIPIGTAERIAVYPPLAMVVVLGVYLLVKTTRMARDPATPAPVR
jgi:hypothetical membrane protein